MGRGSRYPLNKAIPTIVGAFITGFDHGSSCYSLICLTPGLGGARHLRQRHPLSPPFFWVAPLSVAFEPLQSTVHDCFVGEKLGLRPKREGIVRGYEGKSSAHLQPWPGLVKRPRLKKRGTVRSTNTCSLLGTIKSNYLRRSLQFDPRLPRKPHSNPLTS